MLDQAAVLDLEWQIGIWSTLTAWHGRRPSGMRAGHIRQALLSRSYLKTYLVFSICVCILYIQGASILSYYSLLFYITFEKFFRASQCLAHSIDICSQLFKFKEQISALFTIAQCFFLILTVTAHFSLWLLLFLLSVQLGKRNIQKFALVCRNSNLFAFCELSSHCLPDDILLLRSISYCPLCLDLFGRVKWRDSSK